MLKKLRKDSNDTDNNNNENNHFVENKIQMKIFMKAYSIVQYLPSVTQCMREEEELRSDINDVVAGDTEGKTYL